MKALHSIVDVAQASSGAWIARILVRWPGGESCHELKFQNEPQTAEIMDQGVELVERMNNPPAALPVGVEVMGFPALPPRAPAAYHSRLWAALKSFLRAILGRS